MISVQKLISRLCNPILPTGYGNGWLMLANKVLTR